MPTRAAILTTLFLVLSFSESWSQNFESQVKVEDSKQCPTFEHCWQPGEQTYVLTDQQLSALLMSTEEFRELAKTEPTMVESADENDFELTESVQMVRQVGYQEDVVDNDENADETTDQKIQSAENTDVPLSSNGNVYFNFNSEKLKAEIANQKAAIEANTQLTDAVRASRLQILASANDALLRLNEYTGQHIQYSNSIKNIDQDEKEAIKELENIAEPEIPEVTDSTISEHLAVDLKKRQTMLQEDKDKLAEIEKQIARNSERITKIPAERSAANASLEKIQDEIAERSAQPDDPDNQLALLLLEIRRQATQAELKKLESEETRQERGAKLDSLHRDYYSREVNRLQEEVANWERVVKQLRKNEVREDQIAAREQAEKAHWQLSPLAQRNEELVSDRKTVVESLQDLNGHLEKITAETEAIVKRRTEIANKIEAAGLTGTNGMELVDLRRNMSTTGSSHIHIRQLQAELRRVNLTKVGLNEERDELSDIGEAIQSRIQISDKHVLFKKAVGFMETKREYLYQLIKDYQSYGRRISEVSEARKKLIDEINKTIVYIDENAIWIRSADPIQITDIQSLKQDLEAFFDSDSWVEVIATTQQRATQRPYETSMATLTLVVLIAINRRVKRKLIPTEGRDEPSA